MINDWIEVVPDKTLHNTRRKKNRRMPSEHRGEKLGVHVTVNGKGIIARLRLSYAKRGHTGGAR